MYFSDSLMEQFVELPAESFELQQFRLEALAACRQSLSSTDQELLVACYGGQEKIRDVARQLDRPAQSVYSSLARIRRALHHCVERRLAKEGWL
jgi:DNA-directed RNA polymerase specialized sigma24 family protein